MLPIYNLMSIVQFFWFFLDLYIYLCIFIYMKSEIPENIEDFPAWVERESPKWKRDSNEATMKRILITPDGLGTSAKEKALEYLLRNREA